MVVLGVDPHKDTHTVVAVDPTGRRIGQLTFAARREGHLKLLDWAREVSDSAAGSDGGSRRCLWAVEDCRHVADGLLRDLLTAVEPVVLVPPKLMAASRASARTRGKSDPSMPWPSLGALRGNRICQQPISTPRRWT